MDQSPIIEEFQDVTSMQARARALASEGFVVLVLVSPEEQWLGYSAFRRSEESPYGEDRHSLEFAEGVKPEGNPQAIYDR